MDDVAGRFKWARATIGALILFLLGFGGWASVQQAASVPVAPASTTAPVGT